VYSYIPVARGGGDYKDAPRVTLVLKSDAVNVLTPHSSEFIAQTSNTLFLIEANATVVYVAQSNGVSCPEAWSNGTNFPRVFEINRSLINCIQYDN
jgi:hypothetical protein